MLPSLVMQLLNGLTLGMVFILIASGLSFVAGMMNIINIAHAALYTLGVYLGLTIITITANFWLALLIAPLLVAIIGFLLEYFTIRPLYTRDPLYSLLLTVGLALILIQVTKIIWGPDVRSIAVPSFARGIIDLRIIFYPKYRLFVLAFSALVVFAVWFLFRSTNFGLIIKAGIHDPEIVSAFGINLSRAFALVFTFGTALAALAGVIIGPMGSVYPEMGMDIIMDAFIVLIIGGLGSFKGAVVGALTLGMAESFGALVIPGFTKGIIYGVMVAVLLIRPRGLFGEVELR